MLHLKYPFLSRAKEIVEEKEISVLIAFQDHPDILNEIKYLIRDAMDNKESTRYFDNLKEDTILKYPLLNLVVCMVNNFHLTNRMANLLSKHFSFLLGRELESDLIKIASDLGLAVEYLSFTTRHVFHTIQYNFSMHFTDYLKVATKIKAPQWKLVNRFLRGGRVYLNHHDLARIIEEKLKEMILFNFKQPVERKLMQSVFMIKGVKRWFSYVKQIIKTRSKTVEYEPNDQTPRNTAYPPCIVAILDKNSTAQNLAHTERLLLTRFLLTIGETVEGVLGLFRAQPDFNEKISKYHIEYQAGLQGGGTKYKPQGCEKLQSLGICKKYDAEYSHRYCNNPDKVLKNPLVFYRLKVWVDKRNGRTEAAET